MWALKIIIPYMESALFAKAAKDNQVSIVGYPLSHEIKDNSLYITGSGILIGDKTQVKKFVRAIKKDPRNKKIELNGNFAIFYAKQNIANRILYQPGVIHIKPSIVTKNGEYIFELASWERKPLEKIIKTYKQFGTKLVFLKRQKISNIQTLNIHPSLTDKQKQCLQIAVNHHYYDFPRKTDLKSLAKIAKISYTTYQFHLRNAEKKLIPFLNEII